MRRGREVVRTGGFNAAGDLLDPEGRLLEHVAEGLTLDEAHGFVVGGALVAYDGCGCGGGCGLSWPDLADRKRLRADGPPRIPTKPFMHPQIDLWRGEGGDVVFVMGDLDWGNALR